MAFAVPFFAFWLDGRGRESQRAEPVKPLTLAVPRIQPSVQDEPARGQLPPGMSVPLELPSQQKQDEQRAVVAQVRETLLASYYLPVSPVVLGETTIAGIVRALGDPYTEYLTPADFTQMRRSTLGRSGGIGLLVVGTGGGLRIDGLTGFPGVGGLQRDDLIISIDGHAVSLDPEDAISRIAGEPGTVVRLTVRRPGLVEPISVDVVRRLVGAPAPLLTRPMRVPGHAIGYIRVGSFAADLTARLRTAIGALLAGGSEGLVLDLRRNPGGLVEEAVDAVSLFVPGGPVGVTAGYNRTTNRLFASGAPVAADVPLVVLVDGMTASAAEIVAASLADNRRAVVVGESTYGKAAVQSLRPLPDGGALRFTSALYTTPAGGRIAGVGVTPAVTAIDDPETLLDEALVAARRALRDLLEAPRGPRLLPF